MKCLIVLAALCSIAAAGVVSPKAQPMPLMKLQKQELEGRIVNGQRASPGQFPWQVGLSISFGNSGSWCGASVLSTTWAITAAHCTKGATAVTLLFGATARNSPEQTRNADQIIIHTGYNPNTLANDVSLLRFQPITMTSRVNHVTLPSQSAGTFAGNYAQASGWGYEYNNGVVASNLNWVRMQVITNAVCAQTYGSQTVNAGTICTSTGGAGTCKGDSGGPLVLDGTSTLIGVTSFVATAGCTAGYPAGFSRVSYFRPWIQQYTGI